MSVVDVKSRSVSVVDVKGRSVSVVDVQSRSGPRCEREREVGGKREH